MVAVGLLASGEEGEFEVPVRLLEEGYRIVDISVEPDDGDPTHSGVSLARGELV
jgi:Anti-sigma-K factor rskA